MDWTIKLWHVQYLAQGPLIELSSTAGSSVSNNSNNILTGGGDYQCDVAWSPCHPAVFASVTSTGKISLWNLGLSTTDPVYTLMIDDVTSTASTSGVATSASALNKVSFAKDGQYLIVGDSKGHIHKVKVSSLHTNMNSSEETKVSLLLLSLMDKLVRVHKPVIASSPGMDSDFLSPSYAASSSRAMAMIEQDEEDDSGATSRVDLNKIDS